MKASAFPPGVMEVLPGQIEGDFVVKRHLQAPIPHPWSQPIVLCGLPRYHCTSQHLQGTLLCMSVSHVTMSAFCSNMVFKFKMIFAPTVSVIDFVDQRNENTRSGSGLVHLVYAIKE